MLARDNFSTESFAGDVAIVVVVVISALLVMLFALRFLFSFFFIFSHSGFVSMLWL